MMPPPAVILGTPVVPAEGGTTGVPRMTAGGVAFVLLDPRPRTSSFSLFLSVFKPSIRDSSIRRGQALL